MPSGSDLQDSVDRTREAFRRTSVDEQDVVLPPRIAPHADALPEDRGGDAVSELHPFFQGLLGALPEPGTDWPNAKRERWLETARNIFGLIYDEPPDLARPDWPAQPDQDREQAPPSFDQQSA